ncbi:MAG: hypothetical protein OXB86_00655 [Bdellovibrionales bacterium]|nr:hypothetical protein [Bdellovibrionales bacterium]
MKLIKIVFLSLLFSSGFSYGEPYPEKLNLQFKGWGVSDSFERGYVLQKLYQSGLSFEGGFKGIPAFNGMTDIPQILNGSDLLPHSFSDGRSCRINGLMEVKSDERIRKSFLERDNLGSLKVKEIFWISLDERSLSGFEGGIVKIVRHGVEMDAVGDILYDFDRKKGLYVGQTNHEVRIKSDFGEVSINGIAKVRLLEIADNREQLNITEEQSAVYHKALIKGSVTDAGIMSPFYEDMLNGNVTGIRSPSYEDILNGNVTSIRSPSYEGVLNGNVTSIGMISPIHQSPKNFSQKEFFYYVMEPIGGGGGGGGSLLKAFRAVFGDFGFDKTLLQAAGAEKEQVPAQKLRDYISDIEQSDFSNLWPVILCDKPLF